MVISELKALNILSVIPDATKADTAAGKAKAIASNNCPKASGPNIAFNPGNTETREAMTRSLTLPVNNPNGKEDANSKRKFSKFKRSNTPLTVPIIKPGRLAIAPTIAPPTVVTKLIAKFSTEVSRVLKLLVDASAIALGRFTIKEAVAFHVSTTFLEIALKRATIFWNAQDTPDTMEFSIWVIKPSTRSFTSFSPLTIGSSQVI